MNYLWISFEMWLHLVKYGRLAHKPEFMGSFYAAMNGRDRSIHFWYGKSGRQRILF